MIFKGGPEPAVTPPPPPHSRSAHVKVTKKGTTYLSIYSVSFWQNSQCFHCGPYYRLTRWLKYYMVNGLKFQTLLSWCSHIKCCYQDWNSQNACQNSKQGKPWSDCFFRSSLIWVCTVCLGLFGKQLVFKILEHQLKIECTCTCKDMKYQEWN